VSRKRCQNYYYSKASPINRDGLAIPDVLLSYASNFDLIFVGSLMLCLGSVESFIPLSSLPFFKEMILSLLFELRFNVSFSKFSIVAEV